MDRFKKFVFPASLLVLTAVVAIATFADVENSRGSADFVLPKKGIIADQMRISGKFQPKDAVTLGFERSGKISKIYVKVGDQIEKGKLLAELNSAETNNAYAQALLDEEVARAQLDQAEQDVNTQKAKLKSVKKSSTANKYDEKAQEETVDQAEATVDAKEALLKKASQAVANARLQSGKTRLFAPSAGIVTDKLLEEGAVVTAYAPVLSIMGNGTLEIDAFVSEVEVARLALGDRARATTGSPETENMEAVLSAIDPVETKTGEISAYKVTFLPDFPIGEFRSGMAVDLILTKETKKDTLFIPSLSVFEEGDRTFVLVEENGSSVSREVQLGASDQTGNVEVLSGLAETDKIVSFSSSY